MALCLAEERKLYMYLYIEKVFVYARAQDSCKLAGS